MAFLLKNLYECFIQRDALSITINPLIVTKENRFVASNTKVDIDPDALYRQAELRLLYDATQMHPMERISFNLDMKYVDYGEGNIGVITNGGSLGLATSDYLRTNGGKPVNFMDLGAGNIDAIQEIQNAYEIHESDDRVKCILVNCYGGNMSMLDMMNTTLIYFQKGILTKPVVMRVAGLEIEEAMSLWNQHKHQDFA